MDYAKHFSTTLTPQSEKIPGSSQVPNSAGGFTWAVDDWVRLDRFLILGTEGGSYYANEHKLTIENAEAVVRCIAKDGKRVVKRVVDLSTSGRAPKNDPALFVLAMCTAAKFADQATREAALEALPYVARIGTHLFTFLNNVEAFRGWGRGLRSAVASWYNDKEPERLGYQMVKYRQRGGWSHRDALRLGHPVPVDVQHNALYQWATKGELDKDQVDNIPEILQAYLIMQRCKSVEGVVETLRLFPKLPWETIPSQFLKAQEVWQQLLPNIPLTATIRNLARMTTNGLIGPLRPSNATVVKKITDEENLRKARVHPIQILAALLTYSAGKGARGKLEWIPEPVVVDALDEAFYLSFGNVVPTNKRIVIGLDVSGSMSGFYYGFGSNNTVGIAGVPGLTPRVASAAMCMVTARVESQYTIMAFASKFVPFPVSPRMRLDTICKKSDALPFGRTDCSRPMLWAMENKIEADAFLIYTDSETWAGNIHPAQALRKYRQQTGIPAKLVVVGMVSNGFSIADPSDAGMLDVIGFDTATPNLISGFVR